MAKSDFENTVIKLLTGLTKKVNAIEGKFDTLEGKFDTLEGKFDTLEGKFDSLENKVESEIGRLDIKIDTNVRRLEEKIDNLAEQMDIMKNVNLVTILNAQQEMRKELNEKLDKAIKINEVDHKKFDYKISVLELKLEVA